MCRRLVRAMQEHLLRAATGARHPHLGPRRWETSGQHGTVRNRPPARHGHRNILGRSDAATSPDCMLLLRPWHLSICTRAGKNMHNDLQQIMGMPPCELWRSAA